MSEITEVPWDILDHLRDGEKLLKIGRRGKPEFRHVKVSADLINLCWESKKEKNGWQEVPFSSCALEIGPGAKVGNFERFPIYKTNCFSVIHEKGTMSLDIVCKDKNEFNNWIEGLKFLTKNPTPSEKTRTKGAADKRRKSLVAGSKKNLDNKVVSPTGGKGANPETLLKERMEQSNDAYGWGMAGWGQLGLGNEDNKTIPTLMENMLGKGIRYISCGYAHTAILTESNDVYTWGAGGCGRLGTGSSDSSLLPKQLFVTGRTPWQFHKISCGDLHTLAMKDDGKLYAWGHGAFGALGHPDCKDFLVPTLIDYVSVTDICAGSMFSLIIQDDGKLYSCGEGSYGRLGLGYEDAISPTFQCIESLDKVTSLVAGEYHAGCIVKNEELYTWGGNFDGQLGLGDFNNRSSPEFVEAFKGKKVVQVASGSSHMLAVISIKKKTLGLDLNLGYAWGSNACSQLGQGPSAELKIPSPHPLTGQFGQSSIEQVACGGFHSALLRAAKIVDEKDVEEREGTVELFTWGNNTYGQLGLGQSDGNNYSTPTLCNAKSTRNTRTIYCGGFHTYAAIGATWIHDEEATNCMNCKAAFTAFNRRHHCRHCGGVYDGKCTSKKIPLLKFGLAEPQRVCDKCYGKVRGE